MSILNAYLTKSKFYIATDTIASHNVNGVVKPVFFSSKIVYYPHLKGCVVILGQIRFAINVDLFISTHNIQSIGELYQEIIDVEFAEKLTGFGGDFSSLNVVSLFGYNELSKEMEAYCVNFDKGKVVGHEVFDLEKPTSLIHPALPQGLEGTIKTECILNGESVNDMLIKIAEAMHLQSLTENDMTANAIGGELHLATIGIGENGFYCTFNELWKFPDYEKVKEEIESQKISMAL